MNKPGIAGISPSELADHRQGRRIVAVETTIVDVPTTRRHRLSNTEVTHQSYVIARASLSDGTVGYGEAATLGGPRWAEESVEAIKANIDTYLAPAVLGANALDFEANSAAMKRAASRNNAARAAVDAALYDAAGKSLGLPASQFLGGAVRDRIEVLWALASGDADQEIEEAQGKLAAREHRRFKIKLGFHAPADDMKRLARIVEALPGCEIVCDVNQAWSEATAIRYLPRLAELGIVLIEQPLRPGLVEATARIARRSAIPIMTDEAAFTGAEIVAQATAAAGSVYSLKLVKSGGLMDLKRAGGIAQACGMELYGGCLLETGLGAAAHLAVFATLPTLEWGCEHFGPKIVKTDIVRPSLTFRDFHIHCPTGPGLGVQVDEDALAAMTRKA
ncbi:muconate/chloromuconate family cycloisomerase [Paracoccus sp. PAR01]|uniref:muconate/chloromuconate family cycloisomerase n=1 Tax=Paracoccus sp. PAR01 TaxID=2769282 RepID=UPI00178145B4|nr:muconate/chloromuconate family cycloisomerase [Paracoccus sp. PAR01]MBD9527699.1 mandelate racemase [Paracoccus sp. PAR01]